jgi:hypothetical protein
VGDSLDRRHKVVKIIKRMLVVQELIPRCVDAWRLARSKCHKLARGIRVDHTDLVALAVRGHVGTPRPRSDWVSTGCTAAHRLVKGLRLNKFAQAVDGMRETRNLFNLTPFFTGYAQRLANILGVEVLAPDGFYNYYTDGSGRAGTYRYSAVIPPGAIQSRDPNIGSMRPFWPVRN